MIIRRLQNVLNCKRTFSPLLNVAFTGAQEAVLYNRKKKKKKVSAIKIRWTELTDSRCRVHRRLFVLPTLTENEIANRHRRAPGAGERTVFFAGSKKKQKKNVVFGNNTFWIANDAVRNRRQPKSKLNYCAARLVHLVFRTRRAAL